MFSLLPILFFVIIFYIFQSSTAKDSWRVSFLKASLVWGFVLTGITEILSLFRLIVVKNKPPKEVLIKDILYRQKMLSKPVSVFMRD